MKLMQDAMDDRGEHDAVLAVLGGYNFESRSIKNRQLKSNKLAVRKGGLPPPSR